MEDTAKQSGNYKFIQPDCDKHLLPMALAGVDDFVCQVETCHRHYDPINGYFDADKRLSDAEKETIKKPCSRDGMAMFVQEFDRDKKLVTWWCPAKECDNKLTLPV